MTPWFKESHWLPMGLRFPSVNSISYQTRAKLDLVPLLTSSHAFDYYTPCTPDKLIWACYLCRCMDWCSIPISQKIFVDIVWRFGLSAYVGVDVVCLCHIIQYSLNFHVILLKNMDLQANSLWICWISAVAGTNVLSRLFPVCLSFKNNRLWS